MIILGIDPGTATTGFGLIEFAGKNKNLGKKIRYIDCGVILTHKEHSDEKRLSDLWDGMNFLIKKYHPDVLAVEKLFFTKNVTTAMTVSQARGVILLAGAQHQLEITEFTPMQVKMALTGYGRADKKQLQKMVKFYLELPALPTPDDAADALCIAICQANACGLKKMLKNS